MASGPITSWQIDGETVANFIFFRSKITADGECSHKIKRHFLLERKSMTNLDSILKSRDITLSTKVLLLKAMVFPVVIYGCEIWTIKKDEHWRTGAFEPWCWQRLFRVPWTGRRSNQFILKEISPEYSLEGLMLKLKLQYFGHLMLRTDSFEKTLIEDWRLEVGGEGDYRRWDGWMASVTQWTWVWVSSRSWWWTGRPGMLQSMGSQRVGHDWATELNWIKITHSSVLAWKIPWIKERGRLQSMGFKELDIIEWLSTQVTSCILWICFKLYQLREIRIHLSLFFFFFPNRACCCTF